MLNRTEQLYNWLSSNLPENEEHRPSLENVAGDASFRRYFRVKDARNKSFIVMDAPPEKEDCHPFVHITEAWRAQGVRLPEIFARDLDLGFLLLEDFGDTLLFQTVDSKGIDVQRKIYTSAIQSLNEIQALSEAQKLPAYDRALLLRELELLTDWLIAKALNITLDSNERKVIYDAFEILIENALTQPKCAVHRDYHSRNLMALTDGDIGIIDFQDAVYGPATYDLVSLLRDCYIKLDKSLVTELCLLYKQQSPIKQIREMEKDRFLKQFDLMGVQRHMKAAGIFARLALRDGKFGYLDDIPRTFSYILENCERYEELTELHVLLKSRIEQPMLDFVAMQQGKSTL